MNRPLAASKNWRDGDGSWQWSERGEDAPPQCTVLWSELEPCVEFHLAGVNKHNAQVYRGRDVAELLRKLVDAHGHLLVLSNKLKRENKNLRRSL